MHKVLTSVTAFNESSSTRLLALSILDATPTPSALAVMDYHVIQPISRKHIYCVQLNN